MLFCHYVINDALSLCIYDYFTIVLYKLKKQQQRVFKIECREIYFNKKVHISIVYKK